MDAFETHTGVAAPLHRSAVDTDQIIPAVYLKRIERTGFGLQTIQAFQGVLRLSHTFSPEKLRFKMA